MERGWGWGGDREIVIHEWNSRMQSIRIVQPAKRHATCMYHKLLSRSVLKTAITHCSLILFFER